MQESVQCCDDGGLCFYLFLCPLAPHQGDSHSPSCWVAYSANTRRSNSLQHISYTQQNATQLPAGTSTRVTTTSSQAQREPEHELPQCYGSVFVSDMRLPLAHHCSFPICVSGDQPFSLIVYVLRFFVLPQVSLCLCI